MYTIIFTAGTKVLCLNYVYALLSGNNIIVRYGCEQWTNNLPTRISDMYDQYSFTYGKNVPGSFEHETRIIVAWYTY